MVGMSGGVDSSVTALLLKQQGYAISGLFMKNWENEDPDSPCPAVRDAEDAMAVCKRLDIDLDAVNFADEYWQRVFSYFLDEFRCGRTPNPDVLCNREIKFRAFLDHALSQGARAIATGHYARIDEVDGRHRLLKGRDRNKDQSYFLYLLDQAQLSRSLFPLGDLHKDAVRQLARQAGLPNHAKKDSTGICFIGERRFRDFLSHYLPAQPGEICTLDGKMLGQHDGLMFHTIGQRKGLKIGGLQGNSGEPWYVVDKQPGSNRLIVVQGHDHPALFRRQLNAVRAHWISGTTPGWPLRCQAKIRYRTSEQPCEVTPADDDRLTVRFDGPQRAVTAGQSIVFYAGDECLGGAIIESENTAGRLPAPALMSA